MNFLEVYDNLLSKEECDKVINVFEKIDPLSGRLIYDPPDGHRRSTSLYCDVLEDLWKDFNDPICFVLDKGLSLYKEKYSFLKNKKIGSWRLHRYYNIQKYKEGQGYYALHCEHMYENPQRILAWMIYLNDAECGTEFPYQDITLEAKAGRLALWPAAWTHPHKGVTPNIGNKYIATGWYEYENYKKD